MTGEWIFVIIEIILLLVVRLALHKQKHNKLKNILFFLLSFGIFMNLIMANVKDEPMGLVVGICLIDASALTLLSWLFSVVIDDAIARRKKMNPKRHDSARQPVRHGRAGEKIPVRHGEAAEWVNETRQPAEPAPKPVYTPPYTPPKATPSYTPPVRQTPPETVQPPVRQTLRVCIRCGHSLTGAFCTQCGYNHTAPAEVLLLRFVDPERLQLKRN